jgi:hypothetical protein
MARTPAAPPPSRRPIPWPATRPLRIYPTDPTQGYEPARKISIDVEYEPLAPGPCGDRIEVVDYDGYVQAYYEQVDLDDKAILMQGGLEPSEADPRFHQQMVYAVASRTLANFDRALGRRVNMRKGSRLTRLRILPHAFRGRNAYYDRDLHALLFGYFDAEAEDAGGSIPGQTIYTCLSHDIIAHETTHAVVDRLRRYFLEPSNVDVQAFHEGFSDIVALFQHFSFPDLLADELRKVRGDLRERSALVDLARQFGFATGEGKALRSALGDPDARLTDAVSEPHDRGSILVAAVFDGFFATYAARIRDLILIATDGRGELPPGELSPYLVNRIAGEAARAAQRQLDMCIRAFDYLPPVDVTFGDYLRALVTADFELNPADDGGQRAALIERFRRRAIYPVGVISLAEESLRWPVADNLPPFRDQLSVLLPQLLALEAARFSQSSTDRQLSARSAELRGPQLDSVEETEAKGAASSVYTQMREALRDYAQANAAALFLRPGHPIFVYGFNAVFRTSPNGRLLIELVAQFVQTDETSNVDVLLGGIKVRGGTTIVVGADGLVRYAIAKPLPGDHLTGSLKAEAPLRVARQAQFVAQLDARDPLIPYMTGEALKTRMLARMSLRALHAGAGS